MSPAANATATSTKCIRPVSRRLPATEDCLNRSSLPFSCVLTPLADCASLSIESQSLSSLPKCSHCGAPHTTSDTAWWNAGVLLCYLCASVSTTIPDNDDYDGNALSDDNKAAHHSILSRSNAHVPFSLPLRLSTNKVQYAVPAISCPVIWWIVLDGTVSSRSYWHAVSTTLQTVLQDIPEHVHVSLILAGETTSVSANEEEGGVITTEIVPNIGVFQLDSAVPHVLHYTSEDQLITALAESWVPAAWHKAHITAAVRALMDYSSSASAFHRRSTNGSHPSYSIPVATVIDAILSAVGTLSLAGQRGVRQEAETARYNNNNNNRRQQIPPQPPQQYFYAGGKITVLAASRPSGVSKRLALHNTECHFHALHETTTTTTSESNHVPDTAGLLTRYDCSEDVLTLYQELGKECAHAALGVDLMWLVDSAAATDGRLPDYGIALVSPLTQRSGGSAPVVIDLAATTTDATANESGGEHLLHRELLARTPWHENTVFGAELRIRLPPGFAVDAEAQEEAGLVGPASAVVDATHLWCMGSCDPYTSYTVELTMNNNKVHDRVVLDGFGEVHLKHAIQTCFAYTAVVRNEEGKYMTVRQMRIASRRVPLVYDPEHLFNALDPEALAVVLFHKLALAFYQDGLAEVPLIAEEWLQTFLTSVYRSAEQQAAVEREREEKGLETSEFFYANERLLDREGELSVEEVLLAQGHDRLRPIPLMVYLLLQCDALRLSSTSSIDLRYTAVLQMLSMSPSVLTRCIAPRLQLWASGQGEEKAILDLIDLRSEALQLAVLEYSDTSDLLLLLDAPNQIVVMDAQHVSASSKRSKKKLLVLSESLKKTIKEAVESYRIQPPVVYNVDAKNSQASELLTQTVLQNVMIEDAPSPTGHANYRDWKNAIAVAVNEMLGNK